MKPARRRRFPLGGVGDPPRRRAHAQARDRVDLCSSVAPPRSCGVDENARGGDRPWPCGVCAAALAGDRQHQPGETDMAAFDSYDVSLQFIRELRNAHTKLAAYDAEEADQLHRAAGSIARNLAEGSGRFGKDQQRFYRHAFGSQRECRATLEIAAAWGVELDAPLATLDRLGALLWRLTHQRR